VVTSSSFDVGALFSVLLLYAKDFFSWGVTGKDVSHSGEHEISKIVHNSVVINVFFNMNSLNIFY
jgi:hypothetical protein